MVEYKFDEKSNRAIACDTDIIIGESVYIVQDNYWNIIHTEVDSMYQGRGIAKKLVNEVILNAKKNNKKVIADCLYAKRVINDKEEREA